mgnify:CR=1 FL=1
MTIGLICGCFDLFHIGHLNILKRCKDNCDFLIVGVNTNESIISHKKHKPIIDEADRLEIIKAIRYVNEAYLITKEVDDRIAFCKQHDVNVFFAGDDWKDSDIFNAIAAAGIKVTFFSYTQGISSTQLKEKIKDQ